MGRSKGSVSKNTDMRDRKNRRIPYTDTQHFRPVNVFFFEILTLFLQLFFLRFIFYV